MIDQLKSISAALARRFPDGNSPFQMMARLLEECGELAQQVNHFEDLGVKREKYGEPDRAHMAQEVKGALICLLQVVEHYGIEAELEASVERSYQNLKREGFIE